MADSRRITILHVLDDLDTGGTERQMIAFLSRSDQSRFRHEMCALSEGGRFVADLEGLGIPVHILGVTSRRDLGRAAVRLWRLVRAVAPDLIHAALYRPGVTSRCVGRVCGIPVITTLVNTTYEPEWRMDNPHVKGWKVWITQTLDGLTARWWGTRFVAITQSVKASAVRQLGLRPGNIAVIPRGLVVDEYAGREIGDSETMRASVGWKDTYPVILNVARLVPQKGQPYAIAAMKDVVLRFPRARLVIVGEGWLRPRLEESIRTLGLENHVTLLGERRDVPALLRAADIFVFPSLYEGIGNALLEAMAAGKPCVASRIPVLSEVTGDGTAALLADPQSPPSLATHLIRLAEDREFATQLGEGARAWVRSRYDIVSVVAALEAFFQQVAADGGVRAKGIPARTRL